MLRTVSGVGDTSSALARRLEDALEQQRAVSSILRAVAQSAGLQPVLDEVAEAARRLCRAENADLYLAEGDLLHLFSHSGAPEIYEYNRDHPHPRDRRSIIGRVALSSETVQIPDVEADPEYTWEAVRTIGNRALLGVPILLETQLIGAIALGRQVPEPFSDEQVELVKTFADQAAIVIRTARLVGTVERQLDQQRAVGEVLGVVARGEGLDAVFDAAVTAAARLCSADFGQLCIADGEVFRAVGWYGTLPVVVEYERAHPMPRDRTSAVGRVAVTGDVVHIPDTQADPEYAWAGQPSGGYRAMLAVPIFVEKELIGVISVVRTTPGPYTEEHIELVKTFADQAAIAIANARLIEAVERQRTELARFVSPQVADLLSADDGEQLLAGHRAYVTVVFCDLRGFTSFSETAAPEELIEVLREYHTTLGTLIPRFEGTLEHFAGDGLMVFFNDPLPVKQHELKAIRFALTAQEHFAELAEGWRKRGIELGLGAGITSGYATLGRIGFEGRYDYGVIGAATSLASRLSTEAKPGQTLISQRVYAAVEDKVRAEPVGELTLKGFGRSVLAYEVGGLHEEPTTD